LLNHISIGVRELSAARAFYDTVLAELGVSRQYGDDAALGYGRDAIAFWVLSVESPVPASMANGLHVCFEADHRSCVDAFHAAGLAAGGKDNGPPGIRAEYGENYYAAFLIAPEGYRIEAYCSTKG